MYVSVLVGHLREKVGVIYILSLTPDASTSSESFTGTHV
jgi:hypothetical protein